MGIRMGIRGKECKSHCSQISSPPQGENNYLITQQIVDRKLTAVVLNVSLESILPR